MKVIIWTSYGPPEVLQLCEVATPVPADNEILVEVKAATVFAGDCEARGFRFPVSFWIPIRLMFGLIKPRKRVRILGQELAGAEVTAVDSAIKLDMLRSIGADRVIDYAREDFTRTGESYDVIIDIVGKSPYSASVACLNPNGRYILGNPRFAGLFKGLWTSRTSSKKVIAALAGYRNEDLETLKELIEAGKLKTVIDRSYTLEQIVEAHHYVESGQKTGHVVINIGTGH